MRWKLVQACLVLAVVATIVSPSLANAAECAPACITISGSVIGPMGEAVPDYNITFQRPNANFLAKTDAAGAFSIELALPTSSSQCYQVAGQPDAFYAHSSVAGKVCGTAAGVNLYPKIRSNSFSGSQKVYIPDPSVSQYIPVEVQALSRTYPAPFDGQPMPWTFGHYDPMSDEPYEYGEQHHGYGGVFNPPTVTKIADGVWKYAWTKTVYLKATKVGFYDFDWGRGDSVFNPMMECRMYWFGFGIESFTPARPLPGQTVTVTGRSLGSVPGAVRIRSTGQTSVIEGSSIVSWSDTSVTFVVPLNAKTGYLFLSPPSGVATNQLYLPLDATRLPV